MNPIIRKIMSLRKDNMESNIAIKREINQGGGKMIPIRKINPLEKSSMEHKKIQELQNKIMEHRNNIGLTKGITHDIRKRQFIKKGILGLIAGIGIAFFSKVSRAATGGINFYGEPDTSLVDSSVGVAKFWVKYDGASGAIDVSHNVTSVSDAGTGDHTVTIATDFSGADWCAIDAARNAGAGRDHRVETMAAGTLRLLSSDGTNPEDSTYECVVGFGDQ